MTKKLFWQNPYLTECKAKVVSIAGNKVKLDQTIFFAFSGGQESDHGTIGGINVISAVKQGDKESILDIEYELEKEPDFKVGDEVVVKINGERREKLRKIHSAAHIVYYFVIEKLGKLKIIGSNIAEEKARIDFLYDQPLNDVLPEIQDKVNKFLQENHAIITKDDEQKPNLRWWNCEEWEMPCGGTHPKSTGEIGNLELQRKNIGSGKKRIEIRLTS
ncbi:MAG: alanyl-tRNA editing protein [Nanoarchaeota archaeon]|nr:alanyl-tRNA editing protein [Nanoarchaeota archaeon]